MAGKEGEKDEGLGLEGRKGKVPSVPLQLL